MESFYTDLFQLRFSREQNAFINVSEIKFAE